MCVDVSQEQKTCYTDHQMQAKRNSFEKCRQGPSECVLVHLENVTDHLKVFLFHLENVTDLLKVFLFHLENVTDHLNVCQYGRQNQFIALQAT